ncbi:hypothetical protein [Nitrospira sp. Nam74]
MKDTTDGPTDADSPVPEREEDEASDGEQEEQYHAVIEPDPLLEEVGDANEKAGHSSERRRIVPSKPC